MVSKKIPKLHVVFDTNVLFTQVASDLVRASIHKLVTDNSGHPDLSITWNLPKTVVGERRFQMLTKAKELLPSLSKMEKLLGHGFGIGEDSLEMYVDRAIEESIKSLGIEVIELDTTKVDWNDLIDRSVMRIPPFEVGEKEKGFRDSLIAQSFFQLVEASPSTAKICRIALVSEDEKLRTYIDELTKTSSNVRVLSSLDELESLINTLVSEIPEDFAEELTRKASKLFFEKENSKSVYYKLNVREELKEKFSAELENAYFKGCLKDQKTWWISEPVFIKKNKSKLYWVTPVEVEFDIYRMVKDDSDVERNPLTSGLSGLSGQTDLWNSKSTNAFKESLLGSLVKSKKVIEKNGRDIFEVHWSTNLSQAHNLTSPKIEKIEFLGNNLDDIDL